MSHTEYIGGKELHHEPWDMDCLSFFELETICTENGYTHGDLMYYAHLAKPLDDGLVLISSYMDVLEMVICHKGHNMIVM